MKVPLMCSLPRILSDFLTSLLFLFRSMQALLNTWSPNTDILCVANLLHLLRAVRGLALDIGTKMEVTHSRRRIPES